MLLRIYLSISLWHMTENQNFAVIPTFPISDFSCIDSFIQLDSAFWVCVSLSLTNKQCIFLCRSYISSKVIILSKNSSSNIQAAIAILDTEYIHTIEGWFNIPFSNNLNFIHPNKCIMSSPFKLTHKKNIGYAILWKFEHVFFKLQMTGIAYEKTQ